MNFPSIFSLLFLMKSFKVSSNEKLTCRGKDGFMDVSRCRKNNQKTPDNSKYGVANIFFLNLFIIMRAHYIV